MPSSPHHFRATRMELRTMRMADVRQLISPAQCRGARGLVSISQAELADLANVSQALVCNFESGRRSPGLNKLRALRAALEFRGIMFIDSGQHGPGVRLRGLEQSDSVP